jgi:hypothetical protein
MMKSPKPGTRLNPSDINRMAKHTL